MKNMNKLWLILVDKKAFLKREGIQLQEYEHVSLAQLRYLKEMTERLVGSWWLRCGCWFKTFKTSQYYKNLDKLHILDQTAKECLRLPNQTCYFSFCSIVGYSEDTPARYQFLLTHFCWSGCWWIASYAGQNFWAKKHLNHSQQYVQFRVCNDLFMYFV